MNFGSQSYIFTFVVVCRVCFWAGNGRIDSPFTRFPGRFACWYWLRRSLFLCRKGQTILWGRKLVIRSIPSLCLPSFLPLSLGCWGQPWWISLQRGIMIISNLSSNIQQLPNVKRREFSNFSNMYSFYWFLLQPSATLFTWTQQCFDDEASFEAKVDYIIGQGCDGIKGGNRGTTVLYVSFGTKGVCPDWRANLDISYCFVLYDYCRL